MHLPSRFKRRGPQFKMSGRTMKWRRDTYEPSQPSDRENSPEIFSLEWQDCDTHPILDLVVVCPPPDKGGGQPLKFPTPNDALLCIGWHKSHAEKLMELASSLVRSRLRGRRDIVRRWRDLLLAHEHRRCEHKLFRFRWQALSYYRRRRAGASQSMDIFIHANATKVRVSAWPHEAVITAVKMGLAEIALQRARHGILPPGGAYVLDDSWLEGFLFECNGTPADRVITLQESRIQANATIFVEVRARAGGLIGMGPKDLEKKAAPIDMSGESTAKPVQEGASLSGGVLVERGERVSSLAAGSALALGSYAKAEVCEMVQVILDTGHQGHTAQTFTHNTTISEVKHFALTFVCKSLSSGSGKPRADVLIDVEMGRLWSDCYLVYGSRTLCEQSTLQASQVTDGSCIKLMVCNRTFLEHAPPHDLFSSDARAAPSPADYSRSPLVGVATEARCRHAAGPTESRHAADTCHHQSSGRSD